MFGRLLDAICWNGADDVLRKHLGELQDQIGSLKGVQTINSKIQDAWSSMYQGRVARNVMFRAIEEEPAQLLKLLAVTFQPSEVDRTMSAADLSDGLRSLFSLSLSFGFFEIEQALRDAAIDSGFTAELTEQLPALTVFAIEEPENHLSPHYLGQVVKQMNNVSQHTHAQVLISSHSPSILSRIEPDHVRYFLGNETADSTQVKKLPLPGDSSDDSFKFVREAVRGYPELYFSRLVIPYLTLLDLDREKEGAGWGRIQYVRDQLVSLHGKENPILQFRDANDQEITLAAKGYDTLSSHNVGDTVSMDSWLNHFQLQFGVFFSSPLDLDFSLLESFCDVYKSQAAPPLRGPQLPDTGTPDYLAAIDSRVRQVLASKPESARENLGATYGQAQRELFPWYKYLFVDGSKPVSHRRAMIDIDDEELIDKLPPVLKALVDRAKTMALSNRRGV